MRRLIIEPDGWPCKLSECPPGHFVFDDSLCFKTEYGDLEVYNEAGECFHGGVTEPEKRSALMVQPVKCLWVEEEE